MQAPHNDSFLSPSVTKRVVEATFGAHTFPKSPNADTGVILTHFEHLRKRVMEGNSGSTSCSEERYFFIG